MNKETPESAKSGSGKGFDTAGMPQGANTKAIKWFVSIFIPLVVISVIMGVTGTGIKLQNWITKQMNSTYSGEVRNCIASVLGNAPDCAPSTGGQCLPTIINGRAPACGSLSGNEEDCPLVTVTGAKYNPYRWCYSIGGPNNLCIPCQP